MRRKILLFDEFFFATCEVGRIIRSGQWIDSELSVKECEENCKKQASFVCEEKGAVANEYRKACSKVETGDWFASKFFRRIIVHMQLLEAVEGEEYSVERDILETLVAYLGNGVYYDIRNLKLVMKAAGDLYLVAKKEGRSYKARVDESTQLLITAINDLKKEGLYFSLVQGEPEFEADSENTLISKIEEMIKQIGGLTFIRMLFESEISRQYNIQLNRYLICRNKKSFYGNIEPESRIPYQYLIQLSLKNLSETILVSEEHKKTIYEKIIHLSKAYLEVLQLQSYFVMEDLFEPLEDFTYRLGRNLCFEKMYIPRQYHPDYIKMLLYNMLEPFYSQIQIKPRVYSFFNYVKVVEYILGNAMGPRIFLKDELKDALCISEYKLNTMLQDISMDKEQVNIDFSNYMDETNTWRKPLIKLNEEQYFCLDGRMSGYAFYEVMYQILFEIMGTELSKKQGLELEKMVYKMFRNKHFSYVTGKYKKLDDLPERDCDMILESCERVMFLEIKKCPLPNSYEQGDDVKVLQVLGDGMLYAQEQIFWHKLRLKEKGVLELYDTRGNWLLDYSPGNKPIIAASICMPEYDFLTERTFTEAFLESILRGTYHAIDPEREKLLRNLNKRGQMIQAIVKRLYDGEKYDVRRVFFKSQFRSLQQIWTILQFCDTVEAFLNMCNKLLIIVTGAGDVYADILSVLQLEVKE